jgi:DNA-binding CsgD family transcriptional regulator
MCTAEPLSPRELEVVQHLAAGLTNAEIAARLHISHRTVQAHIASGMRKTATQSRTSLAVLAVIRELVTVSDTGRDCTCPNG